MVRSTMKVGVALLLTLLIGWNVALARVEAPPGPPPTPISVGDIGGGDSDPDDFPLIGRDNRSEPGHLLGGGGLSGGVILDLSLFILQSIPH